MLFFRRAFSSLVKALFLTGLAGSAHCSPAANEIEAKAILVATRGTSVRILELTPPEPRGALILLAGGHGNINLDVQGSIGWGDQQPNIRLRKALAASGFLVAVVDVPMDRKPPTPIAGYRTSLEQATDIENVESFLAPQASKIFLVAFDTAAASVVTALSKAPPRPEPASSSGAPAVSGVILISPVTVPGRRSGLTLDSISALATVAVPTLLITESADTCPNSPPKDIDTLAHSFPDTGGADVTVLSGYHPQHIEDELCGLGSAHYFAEEDDTLLVAITRWLNSHTQ